MLSTSAFADLESSGGGLLRSRVERFVAVVPREGDSQTLVWSNNDGQRPFPDPIAVIVGWLETFDADGAQPLETYPPDVCPVKGGFRPLT